uniref:Uncharacterized protein n=1 Tax=Sphaerodactylus townsendi TaxID=933632 RepID=A0ACB8F3U0_9SAUR
MAFLVSKVIWDLRVTEVKLAPLVHEEKMVLRVPKAVQAQQETQVGLVQLGKRVNLVFQDCQDIQEGKDQR